MHEVNSFGQPIGDEVPQWTPCQRPVVDSLVGRYCTLRRLSAADVEPLFDASSGDEALWTYLPFGPFASPAAMAETLSSSRGDAIPYVIVVDGRVAGTASYLRCRPEHGSIEVGAVLFAPALQRTAAATEAMFLMAEHAFGLGYRRYEWKCNDLNKASHHAALRLGFTFEGVFRSDLVVKGRNRDTAWFSMLAREWPHHRAAFERWLHVDNFNAEGVQRRSLSSLREG